MSGPSTRASHAGPMAGRALAIVATLVTLGGACRDLPVQVRRPVEAPTRAMAAARSSCAARTRAERVEAIRAMVAALPPAAALVAETRLLPALAGVRDALGGQDARLAAAVATFVAGVESLRLRAPFEQREALVAEAECLLGADAAVGATGGPAA